MTKWSDSIIAHHQVFSRVEGAIDHQILRIHHVRDAPNATASNLMCLAIGGVRCILRLSCNGPASFPYGFDEPE
jgi:uncharacterized membrane protein